MIKYRHILFYTVLICGIPATSYAYLDPASGNAFIYLLVSFFAGAAYTIKGVYYRVAGKKLTSNHSQATATPIALLSEGAMYWSTFTPIVDNLIAKKQHFTYYSLDVADPALCIDNEFMQSKFLGNGAWGLSKACKITNPIVLSTTPNIGTEGYPISKSPHTKKLIHVFHSMLDIADYHKGSLDNYDTVYLVGDFQATSIRDIEKVRNIPQKELKALGLPYFDVMKNVSPAVRPADAAKTLLIAPSWGSKSCLAVLGSNFIHELAQSGYQIIIRPHPQSLRVEAEFIKEVQEELKQYANIEWDTALSNIESLKRADCMISDVSSVRFDFAFFQKKPVITIEIPQEDMIGYEMEDLPSSNIYAMNHLIGRGIKKENANKIVEVVQDVLDTFTPDKVDELRDANVANFTRAGAAICDELLSTAKNITTLS